MAPTDRERAVRQAASRKVLGVAGLAGSEDFVKFPPPNGTLRRETSRRFFLTGWRAESRKTLTVSI